MPDIPLRWDAILPDAFFFLKGAYRYKYACDTSVQQKRDVLPHVSLALHSTFSSSFFFFLNAK